MHHIGSGSGQALENYEIDPRWRQSGSHDRSRSRGASPHTLGFSIAAHLLLAATLLLVLLRLRSSRPAHPDYMVAQIVDHLPGGVEHAGAGATQAEPSSPATAHDSAPHARSAIRRPHKLRRWIGIRGADAEHRAEADKAGADSPEIATAEPIVLSARPGAPIEPVGVAPDGGAGAIDGHGAEGLGAKGATGYGSDREARAAYGAAPAPDYPEAAREMEQQGVVTLRVLVSADGAPKQVKIAHSSGFELLDRAALETVRERWRFVPAMRAGAAIESWVTVPIRFALTEADAAQ